MKDFEMKNYCVLFMSVFFCICFLNAEEKAKVPMIKEVLGNEVGKLPFSFVYGGISFRDIAKNWKFKKDVKEIDAVRRLHSLSFKDSDTGLEVIYEATEYLDFPAVEWVIGFKNHGKKDTPILEKIQALDVNFTRSGNSEYVLYHTMGSAATISDFTPMQDRLDASISKKLSCRGGRSSDGDNMAGSLPFFDIAYDNGGVIFAVGWSGQWISELKRNKAKDLAITAGMEFTHLKLYPGEEIRTPRLLMFFWDGKRTDAHNDFRQFILKHHTPHQKGKPAQCPLAATGWFKYKLGSGATEENQVEFINQFIENKIEPEYYWLDAGWYENEGAESWTKVGTWSPKKSAFPHGLKPLADHAKKNGIGFLLWFEPERVCPGTSLFKEHPDWLIMLGSDTKLNLGMTNADALLNLGNPKARQWLTDHISTMIDENGIGIYRQDFNIQPLEFWRKSDAPDRQGISEIRYIEGLYALWDELLRRHPNLIIDNCASGGRRIDLETISRSVVLWRTDYVGYDSEGPQSHNLALNQYLPSTATSLYSINPNDSLTDAYIFRSHLAAGMVLAWDPGKSDFNAEEARQRIKEFKLLRPLFYGDFYPLTANSISTDSWCAYQLMRKDLNFGAILVFRRKDSPYSVASFKLHGLDFDGNYEFTDIDSGVKSDFTGKFLIEKGVEVKIPTAPSSIIMIYKKL
jgi:alpha-galactosidase